ncbi:ATP-binding cassette domain-containing protein [Streptomyces mashuensis]|nr:ABC transporter ATP-binding protein [Streptomyces mashuensis]
MEEDTYRAASTAAGGPALAARGLGVRFRSGWALEACDFTLPTGRVTALVGPNGAGKSTLFHLATGLLRPTAGEIRVFGADPVTEEARRRVAFLAQDKPLYPRFTVAETLRFGRELNRSGWDMESAERIVRSGNIPLDVRVGTLSQGQCTRIALALAFGKQPDLLLLDEPLADLDPLVRREVMGLVMAEVADRGITVVMSSHIVAELENICDHLLLLKDGAVRLAGDAQQLCDEHTLLTGHVDGSTPHGLPRAVPAGAVVDSAVTGRQITALVRYTGPVGDRERWVGEPPTLEELLLGHLRSQVPAAGDAPEKAGAA